MIQRTGGYWMNRVGKGLKYFGTWDGMRMQSMLRILQKSIGISYIRTVPRWTGARECVTEWWK